MVFLINLETFETMMADESQLRELGMPEGFRCFEDIAPNVLILAAQSLIPDQAQLAIKKIFDAGHKAGWYARLECEKKRGETPRGMSVIDEMRLEEDSKAFGYIKFLGED